MRSARRISQLATAILRISSDIPTSKHSTVKTFTDTTHHIRLRLQLGGLLLSTARRRPCLPNRVHSPIWIPSRLRRPR